MLLGKFRSLVQLQKNFAHLFVASREHLLIITGGAQHFLQNSDVTPDSSVARAAQEGMAAMISAGRRLTVATWNIAAINNNPFEYWITYKENPKYEEIMINVERFLDDPGDKDIPVSNVFSDEMFSKLDERMKDLGWTSVRNYWDGELKYVNTVYYDFELDCHTNTTSFCITPRPYR